MDDPKRAVFDQCGTRVLANVRKMKLENITSTKQVKWLTMKRNNMFLQYKGEFSISLLKDEDFVLQKCAIVSAIIDFVHPHLDSKYSNSFVKKYCKTFVEGISTIAYSERFPNGLSQENNNILSNLGLSKAAIIRVQRKCLDGAGKISQSNLEDLVGGESNVVDLCHQNGWGMAKILDEMCKIMKIDPTTAIAVFPQVLQMIIAISRTNVGVHNAIGHSYTFVNEYKDLLGNNSSDCYALMFGKSQSGFAYALVTFLVANDYKGKGLWNGKIAVGKNLQLVMSRLVSCLACTQLFKHGQAGDFFGYLQSTNKYEQCHLCNNGASSFVSKVNYCMNHTHLIPDTRAANMSHEAITEVAKLIHQSEYSHEDKARYICVLQTVLATSTIKNRKSGAQCSIALDFFFQVAAVIQGLDTFLWIKPTKKEIFLTNLQTLSCRNHNH